MAPRLSILVPVYNEAGTVRTLLERVMAVPLAKEIIVVDDCSTDGTADVLAKFPAAFRPDGTNELRVLSHPRNQGQGAAVRALVTFSGKAFDAPILTARYILNRLPVPHKGYANLDLLPLARRLWRARLESRALGNLGYFVGFILQDYAQSREYTERVLGLFRLFGERSQEVNALANLGWSASMLGDLEAASANYARALPIAREIGNIYIEANILVNLSATAGVRADAPAALEYAQKALELSKKAGDKSSEAWSYHYMGYAYLLLENLLLAGQAFRESIQIREELDQPGLKMEPMAGLIQTYLLMGDTVSAFAETEKVISYLDTEGVLEGTEEPLRVYYACYLALMESKDLRSEAVLYSAGQLLDAQVSKLRDEASRRKFIENFPWRLAIHQARRAE